MSRLLRLDLHTHIFEAAGYPPLSEGFVHHVVSRIRARGLDGIAVTEHFNPELGFRFRDLAYELYGDTVTIIPGQEIMYGSRREVVELYLPGGVTFRFLAHPNHPPGSLEGDLSDLHGLELDNGLHGLGRYRERIIERAQEHGLLLFSNSDAHHLDFIGALWTEVSLEELLERAQSLGRTR